MLPVAVIMLVIVALMLVSSGAHACRQVNRYGMLRYNGGESFYVPNYGGRNGGVVVQLNGNGGHVVCHVNNTT